MGKLSLYAFHLFLISLLLYFIGVINLFFQFSFNEFFFFGLILDLIFLFAVFIDLGIPTLFFSEKKKFTFNPIKDLQISVGMTAYNDEKETW